MRVIIAGSRNVTDYGLLLTAISKSGFEIHEVVSGACRGVDKMGEKFAETHSLPCKKFPADWNQYKNSAGPIRNKQMAEYADGLIAIWDGESLGTKNMIDEAKMKNLKVYVEFIPFPEVCK